MSKPVARLGVPISSEAWKTLLNLEDIPGLLPFGFAIESGDSRVWLYYVGNDQAAITQLVDARDDLQCKSGGEERDWAEASTAYFRAAVRIARAEAFVATSAEGSQKHLRAAEERVAALQAFEEAQKRLQSAVQRDAQSVVEHEEFERQNSERLRFMS
jgi:hypothetical protein